MDDDTKAYRLIVSSRNVALMSSDLLEWQSGFDHVYRDVYRWCPVNAFVLTVGEK